MRQNRSRGRSQTNQLWPKWPQFQQPGRLLSAWCVGRDTAASTLAGGIGGGPVTHAICVCPGGGLPAGVGVDCLSGGVSGLGGEVKLSGEKEGQLDGGLDGDVVGGERDGGRGGVVGGKHASGRGGVLGGGMSARLNPRPRRATGPPDLSGEQLAGPAPSLGRLPPLTAETSSCADQQGW